MLLNKDIKKMDFREQIGISCFKFQKNIQAKLLGTICLEMDCKLSDIAKIMPDSNSDTENDMSITSQ